MLHVELTVYSTILIFASWYWPKLYFIYLPLISLPLVLNCIMIFNIIFTSLKNLVWHPKKVVPENPEELVLLMPCYNETYEECQRSLDSLVNQVKIEKHKKAIMVICDGKVRGPGMEKTTGEYLNQDIFVDRTERKLIRAAYVAWDGQSMDVEITRGMYKGIPYFCIVKQQNQGKRDSLIVIRSFCFNFNIRHQRPKVIFRPEFFKAMTDFLVKDAGMDHCEFLVGMDADTVFAEDCITNLLEESYYPGTVGVCGYVAVDFSTHKWNIWSVYQNAEYTIAQGLRRLHQSLVTKKVSCLPGCCQLLRICEETCGDFILVQEFGYHPRPTDGIIKRIRATASEDRNHVCLMLMTFPKVKTRQALRAYAFTDVPHSLSVFLSQRRRWTLGATGNDLMLMLESNWRFNWWERLVAFCNVLTWTLNFFVIASLGCMIFAFMRKCLFPLFTPHTRLYFGGHTNNYHDRSTFLCYHDLRLYHDCAAVLLSQLGRMAVPLFARASPVPDGSRLLHHLRPFHQHLRYRIRVHLHGQFRLGKDAQGNRRDGRGRRARYRRTARPIRRGRPQPREDRRYLGSRRGEPAGSCHLHDALHGAHHE